MAATDVTESVIQGFGIPYLLTTTHLWTAKATYTQQGPQPGEAIPQQAGTLAMQTAGAQSASQQLRVKMQRGGRLGPGGMAELIYQYEGDSGWQGNDVQTTSAFQTIRSTVAATTGGLIDPDATTFYDTDKVKKIACVYQRQNTTGSTVYDVEVAVYDPSAGTWSTATVYSQSASPTDGYHAAIAYNRADQYLYVAFWVYDNDADLANIAIYRSRSGSSWALINDHAIPSGVDISGSPGSAAAGYEVSRLRMAFARGQCALIAHIISNDTDNSAAPRDQIGQWASAAGAAQFDLVGLQQVNFASGDDNTFSHHSVFEYNGKITVAFPGVVAAVGIPSYYFQVTLPSAYASLSSRVINVLSSNPDFSFEENGNGTKGGVISYDTITDEQVEDGDGSVWVDEDGVMFGAFRLTNGTGTPADNDNGVFLIRSTDGGTTWKYCGDGDAQTTDAEDALIFFSGDASTYFKDFVGVSLNGRQVLIGLSESDVTTSTTLCALFLGGPTNVNLPARVTYPEKYQQSGWGVSYLPFELPANVGSLTTSGSGTDSITTDGLLNRVTSANTRISYFQPTSTIAQGLIVRYVHLLNSGGSNTTEQDILKVRTADGTDDYEVTLRFDSAGFRMWDDNAGSQIGTDKDTVSPGSGIEVLVAVVNGQFSCWYRALSSISHRPYTSAIQDHSLTDDTSTPTGSNQVLWGINANSTTDIDVYEVHVMAAGEVNGALGAGFTNPDDLRGRSLARRGRHLAIDDGVLVTAIDGSAKKGDEFDIDTAYKYPISRIFHADSPSPRSLWRSTAVTSGNVAAQLIPFVLNPDATTLGGEEQDFGSTLSYLTMAGVNWKDATVQRWDVGTSAWVTVATIDNSISTTFSLTRRGNQLICPSLPTTSSGHSFQTNECKGWTVKMGSTYRKISGNTAGTLASNISGPKPVFFLEDIDDSEPTLSTITLIPDRFTVIFHTDGETGGGWAVNISAQPTAPYTVNGTSQYDITAGHLSMGRVHVFGEAYSHGRVLSFEPDEITEDTPGGVRRATVLGPGGRRLRLAWADPVDTSQVQGSAADPDYLVSTSTSGNLAVATRAGTPFDLMGVLREVGVGRPITYLPRIAVSTGSDDTQHFLRYQDHMLCQMTSPVQLENVLGEESDSSDGELMRAATVVLEEIR